MIILKNTIYSRINQAGGGGGGFSNTKSLAFDGVDEYVDCGNISALNGVTEATWMGWFKRASSGTFYLFSTYGTGQIQFFVLQGNNYVTAYAATSTGGQRTMAKANVTAWTTGQWYHFAFVYNEAEPSNADKMKIYIDGVLQTNAVAGASLTSLNSSTANFNIGRLTDATTNEFNGNIDEVAIFTSALTSEQINTIATAPSDLSTYNPIAWYRMGDNSTYQTPQILMPENTNKNKVSNYSLTFDGVDDKISTTSINLGLENTISFWAKSDGTNFNGMVLGGIVQSNYFTVFLTSTNRLLYRVGGGANSFDDADIISALGSGNWFHCALVRNNSGADVLCYINGDLKQTVTGIIGSANDTIVQDIGARSINDFYLTGNIDEISIYTSALTSEQITSIYNGGEPTTISGATTYWKLGEQATFSTNWTVPDQVGSNDGTSANMTIEDRVGDTSNSLNNAVSFNMEEADIDNDTP